jgi:hypothetical protein
MMSSSSSKLGRSRPWLRATLTATVSVTSNFVKWGWLTGSVPQDSPAHFPNLATSGVRLHHLPHQGGRAPLGHKGQNTTSRDTFSKEGGEKCNTVTRCVSAVLDRIVPTARRTTPSSSAPVSAQARAGAAFTFTHGSRPHLVLDFISPRRVPEFRTPPHRPRTLAPGPLLGRTASWGDLLQTRRRRCLLGIGACSASP